MQLPDITFVSLGFPPTLVEKLDNNIVNLVTVLLHSKFFNDSITAYIRNNNIQQTSIKLVIDKINNQLL